MEIKKKEGESGTSLFYRFSKKVQQSGILKEVRKRRFHGRLANRNKRRVLALKRDSKKKEIEVKRKLGLL
ncbi:MAG TPA: 30S ribosomal protein S21 [Candidatus Paceibacterota bacterium]